MSEAKDRTSDRNLEISDAWLENRRLRDLVRKAYAYLDAQQVAEGFNDGGMPSNPLSSNYPDWETSKAKQELGNE